MLCIQVSGCDVINCCDRGASIGELSPRGVNQLQFKKCDCQAVSLSGDHQAVLNKPY